MCGLEDLFDVFSVLVIGFHAQEHQLRPPENGHQHVVEVVGDATRQPPDRFDLLGLEELRLKPLTLVIGLSFLGDVG